MTNEDIAPHIQEIARALGNRVEMEALEDELRKYLEYGVPLPQAKRDIIRNHGGLSSGTSVTKKLAEVQPGDPNVSFIAKVVTLNAKDINVQGEERQIYYGFLGDDTKTLSFTAWKDLGIERGKTYAFANAYVKEFRGETEINLGDRVDIKRSDVELDVKTTGRKSVERQIGDLRDGNSSVIVTGRILDVHEKVIEVQGQKRTILEGSIADATGQIPFTGWEANPAIHADGVVRIANAYVKAFRGVPNLNFGESSEIEALDAGAAPPRTDLEGERLFTLGKLLEVGGGQGIVVDGVILEVKPGSGLIFRCKECNRVLEKRECRVHGKIEGVADLRIKAVVDDGTGAATFFLGREATERLYGKTLEECQNVAKEAMTAEVIMDDIVDLLTARRLEIHGNALSDEFGLQIIAQDGAFSQPVDTKARAEKLLGRLESLMEVS